MIRFIANKRNTNTQRIVGTFYSQHMRTSIYDKIYVQNTFNTLYYVRSYCKFVTNRNISKFLKFYTLKRQNIRV